MINDPGPGLVEAAPYVAQFRDRLVVVKIGGELLEAGPVIDRIVPQIAVMVRCGLRPIVVHGGGRQIDAACKARGIEPVKHRGRRVTTPEVMQVLVDVVGGELNRAIVERLRRGGVEAFGFAEGSVRAVRCRLRPPTVEDGGSVDWGRVGDVVRIDPEPIIAQPGRPWSVPVLASLGSLDDGSPVNVNADAVAGRVASELDAAKLVLLTGVPGVMESMEDAGPISELTAAEARALVTSGVVSGGMRAKVEEALRALEAGVPRVHVISGREPSTLLREIFTDEGCGTLLTPD
jgi:acetylglutamate kinase